MQIVDSYLALTALRQVGYRNTATAIAELVDNSIQADADDIYIVTFSRLEKGAQRASYRVQEIAVLDNGSGMDFETLSNCLSLGWGNRLGSRDGLGRFDFGLKGASISQGRRITIFSWQGGDCRSTYMDLDEIRDEGRQELNSVENCTLPSQIKNAFPRICKESGTIILWSKLDGVDFTRPDTLIRRMDVELCRLYRHFLDDDDTYGRRRNVIMHDYNFDEKRVVKSTTIKANDPLYLLEPSNLAGANGASTNIPYENP